MSDAMIAFRAVHADFRSSRGFVWPFPGRVARASGPFSDHKGGCPEWPGDGVCLGTTWAGVASGEIPAVTILVCSYQAKHLLGEGEGKVRVKEAKVLRVVDFPATLRRVVAKDDDLEYSNLQRANLQDANLQGAYLQGTNLQRAYLQDANLQGANLQDADLQGANLQDANLQGANLQGANLQDADLQGANLQDADLQGADLQGANLRNIISNTSTIFPAGWKASA